METGFFRSIAISDVTLRVRDRVTLEAFYRDVLHFSVIADEGDRILLSATGKAPALLVLEHAPDAPVREQGTAGLYHLAILYPDRAALGRAVSGVARTGKNIGSGDHGVSEAFYFSDPEGNGIELYADRAPADWPRGSGVDSVAMYTRAVDVSSVLAEASRQPGPSMPDVTRIGHIHLNTSDLSRAERFYAGALGFGVTQRDLPGALFLGRDGYHHHIGLNTWQSDRPARPGAAGLVSFALRFKDRAEFLRVASALGAQVARSESSVRVRDPDGIEIALCAEDPG